MNILVFVDANARISTTIASHPENSLGATMCIEVMSMQKYIAVVLLSAGILVTSTATNTSVSAQDKKKDKDSKVKDKGTVHTGHIEIHKSAKNDKYYFGVRDADGKYLGGSTTPYASEKEAREAIETFRKIVAGAKVSMKEEKSKK